jgi:hypothetical protein
MTKMKFEIIVFFWLVSLISVYGHGYIFSKANEEMKENVRIEINRNFLLIKYESIYMGQIAPHIRLIIDADSNNTLTSEEINHFFERYKRTANESLENHFLQVDGKQIPMKVVAIFGPTLQADSLLAPFFVEILLSAGGFDLQAGERELVIDPGVLFEIGNHFLRLAKNEVEFTLEQEKAIRRFLQIQVSGDSNITFISTFPGRIGKKNNIAQIYGVFFEKSPTASETLVYPAIRVKIRVS